MCAWYFSDAYTAAKPLRGNFFGCLKLFTKCFQMLVVFLDDFVDAMSAYAQPTQLIFGAVKDIGNIFYPTKN